jgi:hypothetical protein
MKPSFLVVNIGISPAGFKWLGAILLQGVAKPSLALAKALPFAHAPC